MRRPCIGSRDKSLPKGTMWKTCPHRLFFGRDRTETWGPGGVAFLSPKRNIADEAHIHLYRIT
ncbi:histone deacetylase, partial [Sarracenia purpurea var. burkii]